MATYVSFGMTGFGFAGIVTWKAKVVVAPVDGVGRARFIIVTAEVVAASQQFVRLVLAPVLHVDPEYLNKGATSLDVVAFTA